MSGRQLGERPGPLRYREPTAASTTRIRSSGFRTVLASTCRPMPVAGPASARAGDVQTDFPGPPAFGDHRIDGILVPLEHLPHVTGRPGVRGGQLGGDADREAPAAAGVGGAGFHDEHQRGPQPREK